MGKRRRRNARTDATDATRAPGSADAEGPAELDAEERPPAVAARPRRSRRGEPSGASNRSAIVVGAVIVVVGAGIALWLAEDDRRAAGPGATPGAASQPVGAGARRPGAEALRPPSATGGAVPVPGLPDTDPSRTPAQVVARVGSRSITSDDVKRYSAIRQLSTGIGTSRLALTDLCNRTLLVLAAPEQEISVTEADVKLEVDRRSLLIGSMAQLGLGGGLGGGMGAGMAGFGGSGLRSFGMGGGRPGMPGTPGFAGGSPGFAGGSPGFAGMGGRMPGMGSAGMPGMPQSPFGGAGQGGPAAFESHQQKVTRLLKEVGLTEKDLAAEAREDLLAQRVKQKLVFDAIPVSAADVKAAYAAEARQVAPPTPDTKKGGIAPKAARVPPFDAAAAKRLTQRLRVQRSSKPLGALLEKLRVKFPVKMADPAPQ